MGGESIRLLWSVYSRREDYCPVSHRILSASFFRAAALTPEIEMEDFKYVNDTSKCATPDSAITAGTPCYIEAGVFFALQKVEGNVWQAEMIDAFDLVQEGDLVVTALDVGDLLESGDAAFQKTQVRVGR